MNAPTPQQMQQQLQQISQNPNAMMANMFGNRTDYSRVMSMVAGKSPQELTQLALNVANTYGWNRQQVEALANQIGLNLQQG